MILIITLSQDYHISFLLDKAVRKDDYFIYLTDRPDLHQVELSIDSLGNRVFKLYHDEQIITGDQISAVYYRRVGSHEWYNKELNEYCHHEFVRFWESFAYFLPNALWFPGTPAALNICNNKALQLITAQRLGFNIPGQTSFTNRPSVLLGNKPMIYKSIKTPNVTDGDRRRACLTTMLTEFLQEKAKGIISCPGIIQSAFLCKTDVRATVVREEVYSVERITENIDSRASDKPYIVHDLPEDVKRLCVELVKVMNLRFGAIDLVKVEDSYYFLEINGNGQWVFVEEETGLPVSAAIDRELHRT
jgi:hypothetical protein